MANFYGRSRAYVSFQVRLVPELKERLMKHSFESGQSQVAIVNAAIEDYLDRVTHEIPNTNASRQRPDPG